MGLRYVMGPAFSGRFGKSAQGPDLILNPDGSPTAPAKQDVEVEIVSVDEKLGVVRIKIKPYDLATYNRLVEVRAYLVPAADAPPADGPAFSASAYPYALGEVSAIQEGAEANLGLPDVPEADYVGQLVLGFES